eukprot:Skav215808  [mRNA]  locus=scaffold3885:151298:152771:+ [translate_table: standard]
MAQMLENMELRHFPLDRQLLQFSITASVPTSVCSLEVDEKFNSICRVDQLAEYTIDKEPWDEQKAKTLTKKETKGNATGKEYSQLRATIFVQRKPGKYLVNIVLMIYLLVLASFGTFTIDIDSPGSLAANLFHANDFSEKQFFNRTRLLDQTQDLVQTTAKIKQKTQIH